MSAAGVGISGEETWLPNGNPWITAVAVSLAAFMELLDTSTANVALPSAVMFVSSFLLKKNEPGNRGSVSVH